MVTSTEVACPASASSTELSTTSYTRWCRPRVPVDPMYMPGRLRTAWRPSRTVMSCAAYDDPLPLLFESFSANCSSHGVRYTTSPDADPATSGERKPVAAGACVRADTRLARVSIRIAAPAAETGLGTGAKAPQNATKRGPCAQVCLQMLRVCDKCQDAVPTRNRSASTTARPSPGS